MYYFLVAFIRYDRCNVQPGDDWAYEHITSEQVKVPDSVKQLISS
jgi:hypothetical protein